MKGKSIILLSAFLLGGLCAPAQLLKKLSKKIEKTAERALLNKTEEKTEETVDNAFDGIANSPKGNRNNTSTDFKEGENTAKEKNAEFKHSFYISDVVVKTVNEEGKTTVNSFDADELAMRSTASGNKHPIFIDSEAYQYGYNDSKGRWEKTGLMRSDAMSFMMPMVSMSMLKFPPGPTMAASENFKNNGMSANTFQMVEWAFIYKPEHFRDNNEFSESSADCGDGKQCPKFEFTEKEYKGSFLIFDSEGRLSKIYANVKTPEGQKGGEYVFSYEPVQVKLPSAVEVKMPFQGLIMRGTNAKGPARE